uniref:C-type lectin domain-containing protein n=1 Tax=Chelydra serpentina TaxID=8475 RepID=A0A8C3S199_CHESE
FGGGGCLWAEGGVSFPEENQSALPQDRACCPWIQEGRSSYYVTFSFSAIAILYSGHPGPAVVLRPDPPAGPCCLDGWVGYQGKCYYFSEAKKNWNNSQSHCSALGASLAVIDSEQEMMFLLRYKGKLDHWLGLWREQDLDQPWKWANGTKFNNQSDSCIFAV